jgi:hypothetical protein
MVAIHFKNQEEYDAYMAKYRGQSTETKSEDQHIKRDGKDFHYPKKIPSNQQSRRDLNKKLREQQKPAKEKKEYQEKHPILTKARRVAGKVHSAIQKTTSRYVEGSNEANKAHGAINRESKRGIEGTWVSQRQPSYGSGNDNYHSLWSVPSSVPGMSGLMSGGFGVPSTLPGSSIKKKSTKKKITPKRRIRR